MKNKLIMISVLSMMLVANQVIDWKIMVGKDINTFSASVRDISTIKLNCAKISIDDQQEEALVVFCLLEKRFDILKYLVEYKKVEINIEDSQGVPFLMLAEKIRVPYDIFDMLVNMVTNIDMEDPFGETCLMASSKIGDLRYTKKLIAKGAKVNHRSSAGCTAIWVASYEGNYDVVQYLLAKGADINIVHDFTYPSTPLMAAIIREDNKMVDLLVNNGARVNEKIVRGDFNYTALSYARKIKNKTIEQFLLKHGAIER